MIPPIPVNSSTHLLYTFLQQLNLESWFSKLIHVINLLLLLHLIITALEGIDRILLVPVHI